MDFHMLQEKKYTFLGEEGHLEGQFKFSGLVRMASTMKGELTMGESSEENEGNHLTIERNGFFEGKMTCHHLDLYGEVWGEIHSTGRVVIHPTGRIQGKISAHQLVILPGAELDGEVHTNV